VKILREVERIDDSMPKHYFSEHLARYAFIRDKLPPGRVLDLGCGVGYGCRFICENTTTLVALDISLGAVRTGRSLYHHPKIKYLAATGQNLPFTNESFDAVISFEVIEHISEEHQSVYLAEIFRVLTHNGVAFISTPNRQFTSGRANPYHLKEFYLNELKDTLAKYFRRAGIFGQTCNSAAASVYRGKAARRTRKFKEFIGIQFILPHWAKRFLEYCLTGSTMATVKVEDYQFVEHPVDKCEVFLAVCFK
jgi:SAM-dependent methyltransferase